MDFITPKEDAFTFDWGKLSQDYPCWANPPFSLLHDVVTKIVLDKATVLLCVPEWGISYWKEMLGKILISKVVLPRRQLYTHNTRRSKSPTPQWVTSLCLVDGSLLSPEALDPKRVSRLQKRNKGRDLSFLRTLRTPGIVPEFSKATQELKPKKPVAPLPPQFESALGPSTEFDLRTVLEKAKSIPRDAPSSSHEASSPLPESSIEVPEEAFVKPEPQISPSFNDFDDEI